MIGWQRQGRSGASNDEESVRGFAGERKYSQGREQKRGKREDMKE